MLNKRFFLDSRMTKLQFHQCENFRSILACLKRRYLASNVKIDPCVTKTFVNRIKLDVVDTAYT